MPATDADVLVGPDDVHIVDDNNSAITISSRAQSPLNLPIVLPPPEQHPPPSKPSSSSSKVVSAKPKSVRHKPRTPSPSPPPPPPQPPRQTIRLDIKLGGPSNYEVDISFLSKETGQRPPTPIPVKRDTSESEGDDDEKIKDGLRPPRKRKKKTLAAEYYDVNDPFIDDSELAIDERTYFAQTKQQGFYVSSGEVALLKDKSPKKQKAKKGNHTDPSTSTQHRALASIKNDGTKHAPIALMSDAEDELGTPRNKPVPSIGSVGLLGHTLVKGKRHLTVMEGGKKKKLIDVETFHPDLQESFKTLKQAIANEDWGQKGKFPPSIKPLLNSIAVQAIQLDQYDDYFFALMPELFPYNKFTMTKLIKRTVFIDHCKLLTDRQDELLAELADLAKAGFAKAEEEYERTLSQWAQRQEQLRVETELGRGSSAGVGSGEQPSRPPTEDPEPPTHDMDVDGPPPPSQVDTSGAGTSAKENAPTKRYKLSDAMKLIIWQLVSISNELCRLENEKNAFENSMATVSEQGLRKSVYQKVVAAFPPGWMTSGQVSREVSVMKKKLEKEAADD
ncbi:hypothetical protein BDN71DRAFT_1452481 [Pleurotus eryngii]|uniref:Ubinuclein middle domain-containing protein n=1 Tax=Pleurotus eryngii TaxID=5323 RepID=A0A9P5ZTR4_PLEER|nr:hypothetical protein BDN71DRAFT_1452481 [Pleurotus eryngii]